MSDDQYANRELMDERDIRYQQRYDASQKALEAALLAADRAVQAALLAAKEAVQKAELAADKRFELLNELRTGVATIEQVEALEKIVEAQGTRIQVLETTRTAGQAQTRSIYAAIAAAVGLIGIIVLFANGVF